ncbi:MAG: hypothetical protein LBG12_13390, partial [Synergistaceae bacterium]|nr:hypothetical protein [Synergistaceae bacterium]
VEVPVYADREGLHPFTIGDLPIHLAAMNQSNLTVQGLAAEAAVKGDPELAFWAVAMDPLTGAVLTLAEIRDMVIEMFEAEAQWLPQSRENPCSAAVPLRYPKGQSRPMFR